MHLTLKSQLPDFAQFVICFRIVKYQTKEITSISKHGMEVREGLPLQGQQDHPGQPQAAGDSNCVSIKKHAATMQSVTDNKVLSFYYHVC